MSEAFRYETFLRAAFGYKEGTLLERGCDPAGIANADVFSDQNLAAVKAGTGYAMEIFKRALLNQEGPVLGNDEYNRLKNFTAIVINATSLPEIDKAVEEFRETVIDKYFDVKNGKILLKQIR